MRTILSIRFSIVLFIADQEVGNEERAHELAGDTGWGRHGKEMKESVESKDQEDEAEKETGDDRSNFHGKIICLI